MKKSTILSFLSIFLICSVIVVSFYLIVNNNTRYSAVDTVASKKVYNSNYSHINRYGVYLGGNRIYYSWDSLYNLHISASDKSGRYQLMSDLQLSEGNLIGDVQVYDGVVYFPAKMNTGNCIFFCYHEDEKRNGVKEIARFEAELGPWTVVDQTLIYADYGTTDTNENYTLSMYDLVSGKVEEISSFVYGFSVRMNTLFFLTGIGDNYAVYEYDLLNGQKVLLDKFQYSQNGEVLGMTNETIIMHVNNTTNTDILIYNIVERCADVYTLPWKVGCLSVYEKYAFLGFYRDPDGSMEEINGLYRMDLQKGELQVVNKEINMPKFLFLTSDFCGYVVSYESKIISTKAVVYRFSLEDSSFVKVFSW